MVVVALAEERAVGTAAATVAPMVVARVAEQVGLEELEAVERG